MLSLVWANDATTNQARYVGELTAAENGLKCNCICPSCRLPLKAVNAGKTVFRKRPHFCHPPGSPVAPCAILTARYAALRLYTLQGIIELPMRSVRGSVQGLSGASYEVWEHRPAARVHIKDVTFNDSVWATLTLEDGRELRAFLTGDIDVGDDGQSVPSIRIDVQADLAGMSMDEIRARLSLPEAICWVSHWDDAQLHEKALKQANEQAREAMDLLEDELEAFDVPHELLRETLLHLEVKRILEAAPALLVPDLCDVKGHCQHGRGDLVLANTRLEQRLGRTVPDVLTQAKWWDTGEVEDLLVEVTVSNTIKFERLERIRGLNIAALEIDLSRLGGRITRQGLKELVLGTSSIKRWLAHPLINQAHVSEPELNLATCPLDELGQRFLKAAIDVYDRPDPVLQTVMNQYKMEVAKRGHPEVWHGTFSGHHGILARILSIKLNRGLTYNLSDAHGVLNAIRQSQAQTRWQFSYYFIAYQAYKPEMKPHQVQIMEEWQAEVRAQVIAKNQMYMRPADYDELLCVLFPEMSLGLSKQGPIKPQDKANKKGPVPKWRARYRDGYYRLFCPIIEWQRIINQGRSAIESGKKNVDHLIPEWNRLYQLNGEANVLCELLHEAKLPFSRRVG